MKTSSKWILGALFIGCVIFALSPGPSHLINNPTLWEAREQFVYLSGVCAMSLMVLTMVISIRLEAVNKIMKGLDKGYVVHKWTGVFTTLFVVLHWLTEYVPHWLVQLNFIKDPGELSDGSKFSEVAIFLFQSGVTIAEFLVYLFMILVCIALIKKIPYSFFRKTHKFFPVVFLLFGYHAGTAQLKEHWIGSIGSYLLFFILSIGCVAALISLFQVIGKTRKTTGVIKTVVYHKQGILDLCLEIDQPFVYKAGQYAFLQFAHSKEPHPFSIASTNKNSHLLRFAIKGLGDATQGFYKNMEVGQKVSIEGPYGEFKFEDECERQIWIAGGIGITPFMARLEYLANQGGADKTISFWYCTPGNIEDQFPSTLQNLCKQSGVDLYPIDSLTDGYLTAEIIHTMVGDFSDTSIWFCGPEGFSKGLKKQLDPYEFDTHKFHYDSFSMR